MSHIVQIETEVRDPAAILAACRRLGLPLPEKREARLFSGTLDGWAVELPGWKYPAVVDVNNGKVQYDNFEGRWGAKVELEKFLQAYSVEKAKIEARRRGHSVSEQTLADGSIKVTVQVGGRA